MLHCLKCGREFPPTLQGEVESGGVMLCLQCGHVMTWTSELQLREMTDAEHDAAGTNPAILAAVMKIGPRRGIIHQGSWAMTLLTIIMLVMVILERIHLTLR
jgi:hypothetical protein